MYKKFIKRLFDIILSLIGILAFAIVLIPVSILIYFEDKGSIFYKSKRVGRYGQIFDMYKFRSMKVDAPDIRLSDGSTYNSEDDPRFRIGKIIRKTSIDEFPQFFNVLKGDMSIVGPRPDPPDWLEKYDDETKIFLDVRPGITGYSQAYYRNSVDGYQKMKNDVYYALNYGAWLDLKIILKTLINVIKRENLYKN